MTPSSSIGEFIPCVVCVCQSCIKLNAVFFCGLARHVLLPPILAEVVKRIYLPRDSLLCEHEWRVRFGNPSQLYYGANLCVCVCVLWQSLGVQQVNLVVVMVMVMEIEMMEWR